MFELTTKSKARVAVMMHGLGLVFLVCLMLSAGAAQDLNAGPADKQTPLGLAPGKPSGSYALSGFESVNLYNGNLNFILPLAHISGRGEAGYTMSLSLNSKGWTARRSSRTTNNEETNITYTPQLNVWNPLEVGYGPGVMVGRANGEGSLQAASHGVCLSHNPLYQYTLTRLTFALPDGTEIEFHDQQTNGQPQLVPFVACSNPGGAGFSRGKVFITHDGSAASFISDADITDRNITGGNGTFTVSGYLFLADGLRYRIDSGRVSWLEDRNGNRVSFGYNADGLATVTDPLNRQVTVQKNVTDPLLGLGDRISYPGFAGVGRVIFVAKTNLSNALRSDQTSQTYTQLFPELTGAGNYVPNKFDPLVTSAVYLPDGRRYRFLYNSYGELARVELPTGGAYEYDMAPGSGVIQGVAGGCSEDTPFAIYRRVAERRTSPDGANFEGKVRYSVNSNGFIQVDHLDPAHGDSLVEQERHYFYGDPVDGLFPPFLPFTPWQNAREYQTDLLDGSSALLRRTTFHWQQRATVSWWAQWLGQQIIASPAGCFNHGGEPANDPQNAETDSTLADMAPNQTSKTTYAYDQFNNVTDVLEYDYGASSPTRHTTDIYLTSQVVGGVSVNYVNVNAASPLQTIHLRKLLASKTVSAGDGTPASNTVYNYDEDGSAITDRPGIVGHDSSFGSSYRTRGNMTSVVRYASAAGPSGPVKNSTTYDIAGNVITTTDPNNNAASTNNVTTYTYDPTGNAFAFVNSITSPVPDSSGQHGSSAGLVTHKAYDLSSGLITSSTDANSNPTSYSYTDPLDRLTNISRPDGGSTTFIYGDTVGDLNIHTLTSLDGSRNLEAYSYFDGLGRDLRMLKFDGTPGTPWVATETFYDAMGRKSGVSNAHRVSGLSSNPTPCGLCTTFMYDALSRPIAVTTADGASMLTHYTGNTATVTDQAGKTKSTVTDALGRLIQVIENPTNVNGEPSLTTSYTYDALDDLASVTQGVQHRYFLYDSLRRLIRNRDPEEDINSNLALLDPITGNSQWSGSHTYDADGNMITKVDARNISVNYSYDALNREILRNYQSDPAGTPSIEHFYDGKGLVSPGTNALGQVTKVISSDPSSGSYTYDSFSAVGHVLQSTQIVDGRSYQMQYTYDLDGNKITEKYPSLRVVASTMDSAGRVSSVSSPTSTVPYADAIQYSPHGGITALLFGNGLWEHTNYDSSRWQAIEVGVGLTQGASDLLQIKYDYGKSINNGNILRQVITAPATQTGQNMLVTHLAQYDAVNRLNGIQEVSGDVSSIQPTAIWQQGFTYDQYGNRITLSATDGLPTPGPAPAIDPNTNRMVVSATSGFAYDHVGNLVQQPVVAGQNTYLYDGENRIIQSQEGTAVQAFKYDGLNHRVKKTALYL
jgi:YD repeat-containing protein